MTNINHLVQESMLLLEADQKLLNLKSNPKVIQFVKLSEKYVKNGKLESEELKLAKSLFDDPDVKEYLKSAEAVGVRNGWISGGIIGGTLGMMGGSIAGIASGGLGVVLALGALGGIALGLITGQLFASINKILSRWKAEDDVVKQVPGGIRLHRLGVNK